MTVAEASVIFRYWEDHPPPYQVIDIIARILGWKGMPKQAPQQETNVANDLLQAGMVATDVPVHAGLGEPILDFEQLRRHYAEKRAARG